MRWDRYIAIIGRITQRPEVWDQTTILKGNHKSGACCVLGHAAIDAGVDAWESDDALKDAASYLGAREGEWSWIHSPSRTLAELQDLAITQKFPWEKGSQS